MQGPIGQSLAKGHLDSMKIPKTRYHESPFVDCALSIGSFFLYSYPQKRNGHGPSSKYCFTMKFSLRICIHLRLWQGIGPPCISQYISYPVYLLGQVLCMIQGSSLHHSKRTRVKIKGTSAPCWVITSIVPAFGQMIFTFLQPLPSALQGKFC